MAKRVLIDRDLGMKAIMRAIRKAGDVVVDVGLIEPKGTQAHPDAVGRTVAQLGATHEFGVGVPERSFIRATVDSNKGKIERTLAESAGRIAARVPVQVALGKVGKDVERMIDKRIESNIPPPLSPITIAKKGHDLALVDSGTLRASVDSKVRRK